MLPVLLFFFYFLCVALNAAFSNGMQVRLKSQQEAALPRTGEEWPGQAVLANTETWWQGVRYTVALSQ